MNSLQPINSIIALNDRTWVSEAILLYLTARCPSSASIGRQHCILIVNKHWEHDARQEKGVICDGWDCIDHTGCGWSFCIGIEVYLGINFKKGINPYDGDVELVGRRCERALSCCGFAVRRGWNHISSRLEDIVDEAVYSKKRLNDDVGEDELSDFIHVGGIEFHAYACWCFCIQVDRVIDYAAGYRITYLLDRISKLIGSRWFISRGKCYCKSHWIDHRDAIANESWCVDGMRS